MTALDGRDVKRTFSDIGSFSAGLSGEGTLKAGGQKFGDFGDRIFEWRRSIHAWKRQRSASPVQAFHATLCSVVLDSGGWRIGTRIPRLGSSKLKLNARLIRQSHDPGRASQ
jgi:hypothetical protein